MARERVAHPGGARHQRPAAGRADPLEVFGAPGAVGALERADDRADVVGRQVDVAALAPRSHLQPAHRVILSRAPDRGPSAGRSGVARAPRTSAGDQSTARSGPRRDPVAIGFTGPVSSQDAAHHPPGRPRPRRRRRPRPPAPPRRGRGGRRAAGRAPAPGRLAALDPGPGGGAGAVPGAGRRGVRRARRRRVRREPGRLGGRRRTGRRPGRRRRRRHPRAHPARRRHRARAGRGRTGPLGPAPGPPRHLARRPRRVAPGLAHRGVGGARERRRRRPAARPAAAGAGRAPAPQPRGGRAPRRPARRARGRRLAARPAGGARPGGRDRGAGGPRLRRGVDRVRDRGGAGGRRPGRRRRPRPRAASPRQRRHLRHALAPVPARGPDAGHPTRAAARVGPPHRRPGARGRLRRRVPLRRLTAAGAAIAARCRGARRLHRHGIQAGGTVAAGGLDGATRGGCATGCGSSSSRAAWSSTRPPGWPWPSSSRRERWPPTTPGSPAPTPRVGPPSWPR